jgi:site-specific DNA-methyltransferase (adenine-specific)
MSEAQRQFSSTRAPSAGRQRAKRQVTGVADLPRAYPIAPAHFRFREDGSIEAHAGNHRETSEASPVPECGSPAPKLIFRSDSPFVRLYHGNSFELLDATAASYPDGRFDCIFADPPYFLSNGGITCHAGRMVKVDKGDWDRSRGPELNHEFNTEWLRRCQRVLKPNGTIWITGTRHVIFSVGYALQQLGYRILNDIAWEKPNPPPNLSCRYFTHSTETVLWAAKNGNSKHFFNYGLMKQMAGGKQMKTVWTLTSPKNGEKAFGRHPTQKPVALAERCLLAATREAHGFGV